jgi:hypothetical protein
VEFQRRLDGGLTLAAIADEMRKRPDDGAPAGRMSENTLDLDGLMIDAIAEAAAGQVRSLLNGQMLVPNMPNGQMPTGNGQMPVFIMPMTMMPIGR